MVVVTKLMHSFCLNLAVLALCFCHYSFAQAAENKESKDKQLSSVKQQIAKQKSAIIAVSEKRRKLDKQLKKDDFAIAKVAKAINLTDKQLIETQDKLKQLAKQIQQLTQQKKQQESALAHQLRTAYTTGQHDYLKMLLNQEQAADVQRSVTYYQYLNEARIKEIEQFQATLKKLAQATTEQEQQKTQLALLQTEQKQQKIALEANKNQRKRTLVALRQELLTNQQQLNQLEIEEASLVAALERLAQQAKTKESLNGLAKLKRKLRWPVKGRIKHSFGTKKQGYLRWKGILLSAPIGRQVKSIHAGTVLFADWLKGYGLVTVVDHGKGYMSLYGHNQALLKDVGDTVESGEPIALVGQSGGQSDSGLYFEIRHKGKAVNPKIWCR